MSALKQRLFTNWHLIRIFRLSIGLMLLAAGIQSRDMIVGLFSTFFLYQAITDTGCCSVKGCYTPSMKMRKETRKTPEVTVEDRK